MLRDNRFYLLMKWNILCRLSIVVMTSESQSRCSKWSHDLMYLFNIYLNISTSRFIPLWNSSSPSRSLTVCESVCVVFCSCLLESGVSPCHLMTNTVALCGPYLCAVLPRAPRSLLIPLIFVVPVQTMQTSSKSTVFKAQHNITRCLM